MKSVGIIGFGSFGRFLAEKLDPHCEVHVWSRSQKAGKWDSSFDQIANCDFLLLSIPLDAYPEILEKLKPVLGKHTILIDVCSVKEKPLNIVKKMLPKQRLVATHPLFGPESAMDSLEGHTMVLCPDDSDPEALKLVDEFCKKLNLTVVKMSASEHDESMAMVQGLTFFIAHGLKDIGIHAQKLSTPSFKRLLHLAELEAQHSEDLFLTIQTGNDKTKAIREAFINDLTRLNKRIASLTTDEPT